jgi:negative regulator of flagellin synthesis FlgM
MTNIPEIMGGLTSAQKGKNINSKVSEQAASNIKPAAETSTQTLDQVSLSPEMTKALEEATFDAAKVANIKEAIENGNYPLDSRKIAENFVALERLIGG